MEDMSEYVDTTLIWANERMIALVMEMRSDDAVAIGSEFIAWANGTDTSVYCSSDYMRGTSS